MKRRLGITALSSVTLAWLGVPAVASENQAYAYDELGRLIAVQYSGSINNGQAHSLCYDPAGNRTKYKSNAANVLATCGGPPPPTNQPPVANPDSISTLPCVFESVDVIANDTDPEGHYPLTLTAENAPWAWVANSTTISMNTPSTGGTYFITYTVADSLGASANGTLTVTVNGTQQCS